MKNKTLIHAPILLDQLMVLNELHLLSLPSEWFHFDECIIRRVAIEGYPNQGTMEGYPTLCNRRVSHSYSNGRVSHLKTIVRGFIRNIVDFLRKSTLGPWIRINIADLDRYVEVINFDYQINNFRAFKIFGGHKLPVLQNFRKIKNSNMCKKKHKSSKFWPK